MDVNLSEATEQVIPPVEPRRRRKSLWKPAILVVVIVGAYYTVTWSAPTFEGWEVDYDAAQAKATESNRNVLAAFYMDGCPPCTMMDRFVLSSRKVKKALQDLVPVRLDALAHPDLSRRYQISGTPTYLVANPAGEVLARVEGYLSVKDFIWFLEHVPAESSPSASLGAGPATDAP